MLQPRAVRIAGLVLLAAAYCAGLALLLTFGRIPSQSPDMAFHLQLLEVVKGRLQVPPEARVYLDEMFGYPRFSHRLAALPSEFGLSSFNALTFAAAASASAVWLVLFLQARRVSPAVLWSSLLAASVAAWLTRGLIGFEIVNNYFYPQLVSQAVAITGLALGAWLVRRRVLVFGLYAVLAVVLCGYFHLMGVLTLSGGLFVLSVLQVARRRVGGHRLVWSLLALVAPLAAAVVLHPAFRSMRSLSQNNGGIDFAYPYTLLHLTLGAAMVIGLSILVGWLSLRIEPHKPETGEQEATDFFVAFGLAAASAFAAQALALALAQEGSVYAVKKHAYGLFTALAFLLPLAAKAIWRKTPAGASGSEPASSGLGALALALLAAQVALGVILAASVVDYGVPAGSRAVESLRFLLVLAAASAPGWAWLIGRTAGARPALVAAAMGLQVVAAHFLMMHVIYARPSQLDVARISNIIEHMRDLRPRDAGGDVDHLFVSSNSPPVVAFVANLAGLRVDRGLPGPLWSAAGAGDADVRSVRVLVTETGDPTYDLAACRIAPPAGPIVRLDGACVAISHTTWDFSQGDAGMDAAGWSSAGGALWTTGPAARLTVPLPETKASSRAARLLLSLVGGVGPHNPRQTVRVQVEGGPARVVEFDAQQAPVRFVALPLPPALRGRAVRVKIEAPTPVGLKSITLLP